MIPWRRYRNVSTTTLLASMRVLSVPGLRRLFADQIAAMDHELTLRELDVIANEVGGYLVEWILGVQ